MTSPELPPSAYALCMTRLVPAPGPRRLRRLLSTWDPYDLWERVLAGDLPDEVLASRGARIPPGDIRRRWRLRAAEVDVAACWSRTSTVVSGVTMVGAPEYPAVLAADQDAPPLLCWKGELGVLGQPRVGIVGTRQSTSLGCSVARVTAC